MKRKSYIVAPPVQLQEGRREFLRTAILGAGATALVSGLNSAEVFAAGKTDVLLLSCMDYRLVSATHRYMDRRGLAGKYDHIVLAGASLGAITDKFPDWNTTFWDHLKLAIDLHKIHTVMLLDHRDCGAYKEILGCCKDEEDETKVHKAQLIKLRDLIKEKHEKLDVELLLMNLRGKVMRF